MNEYLNVPWIVLAGGLGNQLFQLAAVLRSAESGNCGLIPRLGRPRSTEGAPDLFAMSLPAQVKVVDDRRLATSTQARRSLGWLLGNSARPSPSVVRGGLARMGELVAGRAFRPFLPEERHIRAARSIGYDEAILAGGSRALFIGYFQTWRFACHPRVLPVLRGLTAVSDSRWLDDLRQAAIEENPVVVHVRRGDYRNEPTFGLLAPEYFQQGVREIRERGCEGRVWIFSDEPLAGEAIAGQLPSTARSYPRIIADHGVHPASVLEAMRLGRGFVLSNSTFGWWGALLSRHPSAPVYAPRPWFRSQPVPAELMPPTWHERPAYFLET